jgi:hypothetical protein
MLSASAIAFRAACHMTPITGVASRFLLIVGMTRTGCAAVECRRPARPKRGAGACSRKT